MKKSGRTRKVFGRPHVAKQLPSGEDRRVYENDRAGKPRRVVIELEPGEPLHGSISAGAGSREPFFGWIELARALEGARPSDEPRPGSATAAERKDL